MHWRSPGNLQGNIPGHWNYFGDLSVFAKDPGYRYPIFQLVYLLFRWLTRREVLRYCRIGKEHIHPFKRIFSIPNLSQQRCLVKMIMKDRPVHKYFTVESEFTTAKLVWSGPFLKGDTSHLLSNFFCVVCILSIPIINSTSHSVQPIS